jgi:hypothetical protein
MAATVGAPSCLSLIERHAGRTRDPLFRNQVRPVWLVMSELTTTARRNKGGRKSKGARHTQSIRFPVDLYDAIAQAAPESGFDNINDFVVDVVERAHKAGLFPPPGGQMPLSA